MRGRGNRQSTPPSQSSRSSSPRYETRFYEWQALARVASLLGVPVCTNVRQTSTQVQPLQSPEADGAADIHGRRILIEAKSFSLTRRDVEAIFHKYSTFRGDELLLIAPSFENNVVAPRNVQLISFVPNLSPLRRAYWGKPYSLPPTLEAELASGEHHFRFVSALRRRGEVARFRNQVDKKISAVSEVLREIRREQHATDLPVRVFWSVSRWLFPKELFFATYRNHLVRRGLVFDVDGKLIHNRFSACELMPGSAVCLRCLREAKATALRLMQFLKDRGLAGVEAIFSGRQGFHVYVLDHSLAEPDIHTLVETIADAGIEIDRTLTLDPKSVVTFPGSIHGLSMLPAFPVNDLASFELTDVSTWLQSAWPDGPGFTGTLPRLVN